MQLVVNAGDHVEAGDCLTTGSLNLHDLMRLKGTEATQRYIKRGVRIYAAQGQDVADKHRRSLCVRCLVGFRLKIQVTVHSLR